MRPDVPGPMRRRGPRPVQLHLATLGGFPTCGDPRPVANWERLFAGSPAGDDASKDLPKHADLVAGIAAYRRHPYQRDLVDPPVIWSEGDSRILDFTEKAAGGVPVLFVPSLINRAYILDLAQERSMMRFLAARGVQAKLLDWGWPGPIERQFNLTDYVAGRLERAIDAVSTHGPIVLAGYCMGGLLALAAAQRQPHCIAGLGLLATPWDFHGPDPATGERTALLLQQLEPVLTGGTLTVDALQTIFALQDRGGVARKFASFSQLDPGSQTARMFVAMEDWLSDGVPLASPVARDCLGSWYRDNKPSLGEWRIAGQAIDPAMMGAPCFIAIPKRDRIVPPESAWPLVGRITRSTVVEPDSGHVAMVAGPHAELILWRPFLDWLQSF